MKVFLSYGAPRDQITALRIQTLAVAATKDLSIHVPPVRDVDAWTKVRGELGASDVLIAIALGELDRWAQTQIKYAVETDIPVIILAGPDLTSAPAWLRDRGLKPGAGFLDAFDSSLWCWFRRDGSPSLTLAALETALDAQFPQRCSLALPCGARRRGWARQMLALCILAAGLLLLDGDKESQHAG